MESFCLSTGTPASRPLAVYARALWVSGLGVQGSEFEGLGMFRGLGWFRVYCLGLRVSNRSLTLLECRVCPRKIIEKM